MRAPESVQKHPNATFVLSTTPITTFVVWAALQFGLVIPQAVAAAIGTLIPGIMLIFRSAITGTGSAIWENGIVGCCKRVWKGKPT